MNTLGQQQGRGAKRVDARCWSQGSDLLGLSRSYSSETLSNTTRHTGTSTESQEQAGVTPTFFIQTLVLQSVSTPISSDSHTERWCGTRDLAQCDRLHLALAVPDAVSTQPPPHLQHTLRPASQNKGLAHRMALSPGQQPGSGLLSQPRPSTAPGMEGYLGGLHRVK